MAIKRKAKPDHWVLELSNPRLGPSLPWKTKPKFRHPSTWFGCRPAYRQPVHRRSPAVNRKHPAPCPPPSKPDWNPTPRIKRCCYSHPETLFPWKTVRPLNFPQGTAFGKFTALFYTDFENTPYVGLATPSDGFRRDFCPFSGMVHVPGLLIHELIPLYIKRFLGIWVFQQAPSYSQA